MERLAKPKTTEMEKEKSKSGQVEPGPLVTEEQWAEVNWPKLPIACIFSEHRLQVNTADIFALHIIISQGMY